MVAVSPINTLVTLLEIATLGSVASTLAPVSVGAWNVSTTSPPASVIVAPLSAMAAAGIEMPSVSSSPG